MITNLRMEARRKRSSSGEAFSFPSTPIHDSSDDFEFGCLTPDSPSTDPSKNSPADHLFFNGRLLPHSFPFRPANCGGGGGVASENCRSTSRTSSISSKDSLVSSRSNSTNSRSSSSSCSSSARTSSSDNSERRLLYRHQGASIMGRDRRSTSATTGSSKAVSAQVYGSSQRWQFMAPVPALSRETSLRRRNTNDQEMRALPKKKDRTAVVRRPRLGRRLFRWFLAACKECHAIEPSKKDKVLRGNVKILQ